MSEIRCPKCGGEKFGSVIDAVSNQLIWRVCHNYPGGEVCGHMWKPKEQRVIDAKIEKGVKR